jgi:hypothetical protein
VPHPDSLGQNPGRRILLLPSYPRVRRGRGGRRVSSLARRGGWWSGQGAISERKKATEGGLDRSGGTIGMGRAMARVCSFIVNVSIW